MPNIGRVVGFLCLVHCSTRKTGRLNVDDIHPQSLHLLRGSRSALKVHDVTAQSSVIGRGHPRRTVREISFSLKLNYSVKLF